MEITTWHEVEDFRQAAWAIVGAVLDRDHPAFKTDYAARRHVIGTTVERMVRDKFGARLDEMRRAEKERERTREAHEYAQFKARRSALRQCSGGIGECRLLTVCLDEVFEDYDAPEWTLRVGRPSWLARTGA